MIVQLSLEAENDLEAIGDYIALNSPRRAATFVREIAEKCTSLADMPKAFPLVPRYEHLGGRHRVYGNYQIFYRVVIDTDRIDVLHILHSARNYAAILTP